MLCFTTCPNWQLPSLQHSGASKLDASCLLRKFKIRHTFKFPSFALVQFYQSSKLPNSLYAHFSMRILVFSMFRCRLLIWHQPEGDRGKCCANYLLCFPSKGDAEDEHVLATRQAKRAAQQPSEALLNHFAWLYLAVAMPVSENKFAKNMHVANSTGARIMADQYLGKHFFNEGLGCGL